MIQQTKNAGVEIPKAGRKCEAGHLLLAQAVEIDEGRCPICIRNVLRQIIATVNTIAAQTGGFEDCAVADGKSMVLEPLMPLIEQAEQLIARESKGPRRL